MIGSKSRGMVVVGASLAGLRATEALRAGGYDGRITVVGAEPHLPYDRPPLSKEVLAGRWNADRVELRPTDSYEELEIELRLGRAAEELRIAEKVVVLDDGEPLAFDGMVIATGAAPRRPATLPRDVAGLHTLRTLDDCLAIRAAFDEGPSRVVVVGAGFIGAEVAATARARGLDVTMLEELPVPLTRGLGETMGRACGALHRDEGTDLRVNAAVTEFIVDSQGGIAGVRLADGCRIEADLVVVGIGVKPSTDWLEGTGVKLNDGITCDQWCGVTGVSGVFAAGDVARWPNPLFDEEMRLEHWTNASEQGDLAGRNLVHWARHEAGEVFAPVPFFWSDQYETKIQFMGRSRADDEVRVVHGSIDDRKFVALYGREGRLVGALGFSMPRALMRYRQLLADRANWEDALAFAKENS